MDFKGGGSIGFSILFLFLALEKIRYVTHDPMAQILYLEGPLKYKKLKYVPVEGFLGNPSQTLSGTLRQPFPQSFGLENFQDGSNMLKWSISLQDPY